MRYNLRDNVRIGRPTIDPYWWSNPSLPPGWPRHDDDEHRIDFRLRAYGGTSQFFAQSVQNLHIFYPAEVPH